jgi:transposase InsO family protein
MESFWSTLKTEVDLRTKIPPDRRHPELAVFDYIETFYNSARRHSSLGYLSPAVFEHPNIHDITAVQTGVH